MITKYWQGSDGVVSQRVTVSCWFSAAMITAKANFNHVVQSDKKSNHVLVTHGLYGWSRHPSYVGWFYWSIGTQVMLNIIYLLNKTDGY